MSEQEIIEGNKLIAEFMGFIRRFPFMEKSSDLCNFYYYPFIDKVFDEGLYTSTIKMTSAEGLYCNQCIRESHHLKDMQFHKSWSWLMPVVEKIEKENVTGFTYRYYDEPNWGIELYVVTSHYFLNSYNKLNKSFECKSSSKIESYWLACVEFIKYYNLCQKEK